MGRFLEAEKLNQVLFKEQSDTISNLAKANGIYRSPDHLYPFCLPRLYAIENIFPPIRERICAYFKRNNIKWHDGQSGDPSNHMCDSQVCCVNFLFPFADQPEALASLLKPVFPELEEMLPIEDDLYVAFEWIGNKNYLGEKITRNGTRTRGANFTSADAIVRFKRTDGLIQVCLIEWKYTESYGSTNLEIASSGQSRVAIYQKLWDSPDCPLNKDLLSNFSSLFYEPFYQLMRQQLLAHEMEKTKELEADIVSLLHISPAHNVDFKTVTSPELRRIGKSPTDVWKKIVVPSNRFVAENSETLFGCFDPQLFHSLIAWKEYISQRYSWIKYDPTSLKIS